MGEAERDLIDRLRLIRSENVGPITFFQLVKRYKTAGRALQALPELARRGGRAHAPRIPTADEAAAELEQARKIGARVIAWDAPDYPMALGRIDNPPPLIFVRGNAAVLARRAVAVVGARNASAAGIRFARQLAKDLSEATRLYMSASSAPDRAWQSPRRPWAGWRRHAISPAATG